MTKILVVGATGFIGTRVAEELVLRRGIAVRATVRDYRRAIRLGRLAIEWHDAPFLDVATASAAGRGCEAVVCCAYPFGAEREEEAALDLCRAAVAAAQATSTHRLVFMSSLAVYGSHADAPNPATAYGRVKLASEQLLHAEHRRGTIDAVVLRPGVVYGPFSRSWTALPAMQLATGDLVLPQNAPGACNAIHVDDVAAAVASALRLQTSESCVVDINGLDGPTWRAFYGAYTAALRPASVVEWPLEEIDAALAAERREQSSWRAMKRALRDGVVRERLNEIPLLAGLNRAGKSLGWGGLPAVAAPIVPPATAERSIHLPSPMLRDLYLSAPRVSGARAASILGIDPQPLARGMASAIAWLRWAGLATGPTSA